MVNIIYNEYYDISFFGVEKFHPFDSHKYSKIWNNLSNIKANRIINFPEISKSDLLLVHREDHLERLEDLSYVGSALEIIPLRLMPNKFLGINLFKKIDQQVLKPMRYACMGTYIAGENAIKKNSFSINLSGGYHHASSVNSHGFCIYSDIGIAIQKLRSQQYLNSKSKILVIDLDAHQGDGTVNIFHADNNVVTFDIFNEDIFPKDSFARQETTFPIKISSGCNSNQYLNVLYENFNKVFNKNEKYDIAFYIAGTDIYKDDPLGRLKVSKEAIIQRDFFVIKKLITKNIPTVMILGGGYTKDSAKIVSDSVINIVNNQILNYE